MNDLIRLGNNIRSLRNAYGESQEKLGEVIYVGKNTVSYYEQGKREPSKEIVALIAEHFMVSVDELLFSDFSDIGKITYDYKSFWKNIETIFPIISPNKAIENEHFKRAYKHHKELYDKLHSIPLNGSGCLDCLFLSGEEYFDAINDDEIRLETAANYLALWYLLNAILTSPIDLSKKVAPFKQMAKSDPLVNSLDLGDDTSIGKEAQEFVSEFHDPDIQEMILECKKIVKRSHHLGDLADYYIALEYILNIVDSGLGRDFNRRVGMEMMMAFALMGNRYAARHLEINHKIMGISSQTVDDR